jgi:hypothetical protein
MKFTLTYDGPLVSSSKVQRVEEKQTIREYFHPQLAEVLKVHPALSGWLDTYQQAGLEADRNAPMETRAGLLTVVRINDFEFVTPFPTRMAVTCHLDILFMRRSKPGGIILDGGDIDNRLLTLFDALKLPTKPEELGPIKKPLPKPLYCLLQDDSQISGFSVRTDQLLHPMDNSPSDVRLVIGVTVEVRRLTYANISLLGE